MNADVEVFFIFLHFSEMLIIRTHYRAKMTVRETTSISFLLKSVCISISWGLFQGFMDGAPWVEDKSHTRAPLLKLVLQTWTGMWVCGVRVGGSALKSIPGQLARQRDWTAQVWGLVLQIRVINISLIILFVIGPRSASVCWNSVIADNDGNRQNVCRGDCCPGGFKSNHTQILPVTTPGAAEPQTGQWFLCPEHRDSVHHPYV